MVREWDAADGRLKSVRRLENHDFSVTVLSPDGRWFLGLGGNGPEWGKLLIWDVASGKRVYSRAVSGHVKSAAFLPDGSGALVLLEYGHGSGVFLADFDIRGWKELFSLPFGYGDNLELSRDGGKIAALTSNGVLVCWDLVAGKELWRLPKTGHLFAFSGDSRSIVVNPSVGTTLERRDAATGKVVAGDRLPPRLPAWGEHEGTPSFALRFTPDGRGLLFHDREKGMVLWDMVEGKERQRLPTGFVSNARGGFTPDGRSLVTLGPALQQWDFVSSTPLPTRLHAAAGPARLQRWDLATGKPQFPENEAAGHTRPPGQVEFSATGRRLLSVSADGTARVWDVAAATPPRTWRGHGGAKVTAGAFLPDGDRVVTMGNDGYLRLWDANSGKEIRSVAFTDPTVDPARPDARHLIVAPDGKTATAFSDQGGKYRLTRWDLATGQTLGSKLVDRMIPSPDGRLAYRLDSQGAGEQRLTDIESGATAAVLKSGLPPGMFNSAIHSIRFSTDGRLLAAKPERSSAGPYGALVTIWDVAGGPPLLSIPAQMLSSVAVAFSRDGRLLAFTDGDELRVWELLPGREVWRETDAGPTIAEMTRLRDSRLLAGRELWRKPDAVRTAVALAFAPDGRSLAAGYDDTTILLWTLPPEKRRPIADDERAALWADLASPDRATCYAAMWRLIDDPKTTVPLLQGRMLPTPAAADTVRPLIMDLGSADFRTREAAERRLRELGSAALPALRASRKNEQRPEAKRRLEALLAPFEGDDYRRRTARAIAVLERIGTPEARRLLEELTREAKTALER